MQPARQAVVLGCLVAVGSRVAEQRPADLGQVDVGLALAAAPAARRTSGRASRACRSRPSRRARRRSAPARRSRGCRRRRLPVGVDQVGRVDAHRHPVHAEVARAGGRAGRLGDRVGVAVGVGSSVGRAAGSVGRGDGGAEWLRRRRGSVGRARSQRQGCERGTDEQASRPHRSRVHGRLGTLQAASTAILRASDARSPRPDRPHRRRHRRQRRQDRRVDRPRRATEAPTWRSSPSSASPAIPPRTSTSSATSSRPTGARSRSWPAGSSGTVALVGFAEPVAGGGDSRHAHNSLAVLADGEVERLPQEPPAQLLGLRRAALLRPRAPSRHDGRGRRDRVGLTICEDVWVEGPPASSRGGGGRRADRQPLGLSLPPRQGTRARSDVRRARPRLRRLLRLLQPRRRPGRAGLRRPELRRRPRRRGDRPRRPVRGGAAGLRVPGAGAGGASPSRCPTSARSTAPSSSGCATTSRKNGFRHVGVALSGGIDSALVALLAADAVGPERVSCVVMPSPHSSDETQADARTIAANLGCELIEIPIEAAMAAYEAALAGLPSQDDGATGGRGAPPRPDPALRARPRRREHPGADPRQPDDGPLQQARLAGADDRQQERDVGRLRDPLRRHGGRLRGDQGRAEDARLRAGPAPQRARPGASWSPPRCSSGRPRRSCGPTSSTATRCPPTSCSTASSRPTSSATRGARRWSRPACRPTSSTRSIRMVDRSEYKRRQAAPGIRITPKAFGRDRRLPITNRFGG